MATQTTNYGLTKPAWDERVDVTVLNNNSDIIDAQMYANELSAKQAVANMADAYDATATYAEGDYCTYGGKLYQANTDISVAEAFDATHWDETTAAEHFSDGGGGGGGGGVNYSTTEQVIGTWIDGKPLYQKSFVGTSPSNGDSTNIFTITSLNVENVVSMDGFISVPGSLITHAGGGSFVLWIRLHWDDTPSVFNDYIAITVVNSSYYSQNLVVTIRYTKTTP